MNSNNNAFYEEIIQQDCGKLKISVRIPMSYGWIENVRIIFKDICDFQLSYSSQDDTHACFEGETTLGRNAVYHCYFSFMANGRYFIANKEGITPEENDNDRKKCWKVSVGFKTPDWSKNGVMYHIFIDRFAKGSNSPIDTMPNRIVHYDWNEKPVIGPCMNGLWNIDFFGGNLKGITEKLDYIKSLGVNIIYISPIVRSQSTHRYDAADYEVVDPYVGTNEDLRNLCQEAHKRSIYIIIDAVFNHTGDDSKYFNRYGNYDTIGAFQSVDSPYYEFYKKNQNGEFEYWWGMTNLPVCDGYSEKWQNYILGKGGIIDQWFNLGIDGLRLDVADELTDEFIMGIRNAVHRNKPDGFILGEVWKNPMRMNRGYISSGNAMDTVMNYPLVDSLIRYYKYCDIYKLKDTIDTILSEYPDETIQCLMNFSSTHDISRIIEILGCECFQKYGEWSWNLLDDSNWWKENHKMSDRDYDKGKRVLKSYISALAFMPGIFSIFYGDEVGMTGIGNLLNRGPYPWENQDTELLRFFQEIGNLKVQNDFLKYAGMKILRIDEDILMYERYTSQEKILVAASRSSKETNICMQGKYSNNETIFKLENCDNKKLAPYGAVILK